MGNAKQKKILQSAGYELEVHDLLQEAWTPERLRPFFGDTPVSEWFNRNAPQVKSGEVVPSAFDEASALVALCSTPLLIRRPLMQVGEKYLAGFDVPTVEAWLGGSLKGTQRWDQLGSDDLERCSHPAGGSRCD